jgi:pimeloyl-ACP methyl ester carboxylesterase
VAAALPVRLHVEVHGEGPALVLGHGFGGSARNFRPQVRALRDRYRVVVFDARGHARSAAPPDPASYTLECLIADLAGVVAAHAGARAAVGGLSLGAGVALGFALARRSQVRGLVLAAPPAGRGALGGSRAAAAFAEAIEREGLPAAGERFVWGPGSGLDPAAARLVRQGFLEHPPHALAHLLRGAMAELPAADELRPRLAALDVPVLIVTGAEDRLSRGAAEALAAALPKARLAWVPGAGHVVNLERPAEFNALLGEFLADLPL